MVSSEELKKGIPLATLGSISILTASFLQTLPFIQEHINNLTSPFVYYLMAGLFLLFASGMYFLFCFFKSQPKSLEKSLFEFSVLIGLFLFFIATLFTLLIFFVP